MEKWIEDLHDLCEMITDEISESTKKLEKGGGKMTAGDLDYVDKLTHALKSIKTTLAMEEYDDGYSGDYSGARGRGRNARRDSMGRYSSDGRMYYGRSGGVYSRDDARADVMERLREIEMTAQDDRTKKMVRDWMKQAERD